MSLINFDNNATTQISQKVLEKITQTYLISHNSSSSHQLGRKTSAIIEDAREVISNALNAINYDTFFTSGGTEANNMAIFGGNYDQVIFSDIEHSSVYNSRPKSSEITLVKIKSNGLIDLDHLESTLSSSKAQNILVSVMLSNSETGIIQPIKEIAKIAHQHKALLHSDMVQACGKIKIDLEDLNVDLASISAHKINGPQGNGCLMVRKGLDIQPLLYGGGHEKGKRSGTLNCAGIAGFAQSVRSLDDKINNMQQVAKIRDFIEAQIKGMANDDIKIFGEDTDRVGNTSYMALRNSDGQTKMMHFDLNNIAISVGSACSSGSTKAPRILKAMGVSEEFQGAMRISLDSHNTMDEARKFLEVFESFYQKTKPS